MIQMNYLKARDVAGVTVSSVLYYTETSYPSHVCNAEGWGDNISSVMVISYTSSIIWIWISLGYMIHNIL